jgi:glycosyltransferase involved in cell wall biosynthesis
LNVQTPSTKLKVSLIVSDLSSRGAGRWGGAVRPFLLAQALRKLGYEVKLFGLAFEQAGSPDIADSEIPIISIPCPYYAGLSGFLGAMSQLLPKIDGDILYAVKVKPTSLGLALVKKMLSRRPLILDIDDWELSWFGGDNLWYRPNFKQVVKDFFKSDGPLRHPDHPLYLKGIERLASHADAITLHTRFIQNRFGGVYVPNGKDTSLFDPSRYDPDVSRAKYGLGDYKVLMFPGAPRPYKGLEDVLIALEKLNQPDLKLAIVGGSPYDEYDQQLIERWGQWIIKLPKYSVQIMPEVVSAAHVIVVPQRNTPAALAQFPLKLTDGMAMAKPILATRVGDIPDILGETGYLVAPDSPTELAAQIQWIFANLETANAKGVEARQRCIKFYSIETMATILAEVFADLN